MKRFKKKIITALLATTLVLSSVVPAFAAISFDKTIDSWTKEVGYIQRDKRVQDQANAFVYSVNGVNYALFDLGGRTLGDKGGTKIVVGGDTYDEITGPVSKVFSDGTVVKVKLGDKDTYKAEIYGEYNSVGGEALFLGTITTYDASAATPVGIYGKRDMSFGEFYKESSSKYSNSVTTIDRDATYSGFKTDAVSSATYEYDANHTVPDGKLDTMSLYKYTKANALAPVYGKSDMNKIMGVDSVDVYMDFDLYANIILLERTDIHSSVADAAYANIKNVMPTYVETSKGTFEDLVTGKTTTTPNIYKAKVLLENGNFGGRKDVNTALAKSYKDVFSSQTTVETNYAGEFAPVVAGATFEGFTKEYLVEGKLNVAKFWADFENNFYGGVILDAKGNDVAGLTYLQNVYIDKETSTIYVALPSAVADKYTVVLYVNGYGDMSFDVTNVKKAPPAVVMAPGSVKAKSGQDMGASFVINNFGANSPYFKELNVSGIKVTKDGTDVTANVTVMKNQDITRPALNVSFAKDMFKGEDFAGTYYIQLPMTASYGNISFAVEVTDAAPAPAATTEAAAK